MKGLVFKITLSVSLLIVAAIFLITYFSGNETIDLFNEYMTDSIALNDKYPYIQGGRIISGPAELHFLETIYSELVWIVLPVTSLALLISYVIARRIAAPLKKLIKGTEEIGKGNLDARVAVRSKDEVGRLARSFNLMAGELQNAQMLRKQFFADAAHELKTPIAVIKGNLEGMLDGIIPADKPMLKSLLEETEYLTTMVGDMKYLALADSGQMVLDRKEVNINDIVSDCIEQLKAPAKLRNIVIALDYKSGPIKAFVDREKIFQVVYNLAINAGKYTPAGGSVTVATEKIFHDGAECFKISIMDTGVGIAAADLPYVFERFYRTDKSRDRKTGGLGLGLSIVKKIVELHGGHAGVESVLNKGSTFYVVVPVRASLSSP
jgi:two-component system sensor histidine kinase BaeS